MKIADKIVGNILGKPKVRGGKNDWDFDGVPNKKDCQPRNTMRQDSNRRLTIGEKITMRQALIDFGVDKDIVRDLTDEGLINEFNKRI